LKGKCLESLPFMQRLLGGKVMTKRETKPHESPYGIIFGQKFCGGITRDTECQLLAFTAYFDIRRNNLNRKELLDKIAEISPSPHSIFQDEDGYLLRFELDKSIDVANEEHEEMLQQSILKFLEENDVVTGELQEMEIGRWDSNPILINKDGEVIQWK
jgi:hypothetical protein